MNVAPLGAVAKVANRLREGGCLDELYALTSLGAAELDVLATRETFQPVTGPTRISDR